MESKIKELKIRLLKETTKRRAIRKEIAKLLTKSNKEDNKK
jgi:hypothetical protein